MTSMIEDIRSFEEQIAAAHVRMNLDTIDRFLHPDYEIIQPGGSIERKADILTSYRSGARRWDFARADQMEIRIYGQTAVVLGRWTAKGRNGDVHFDYSACFLLKWTPNFGPRNTSFKVAIHPVFVTPKMLFTSSVDNFSEILGLIEASGSTISNRAIS